mmetsp:Transcript_14133/g.57476  ORF Transcript_14133/g.57476 Transcript_14133/m.57476 type:complete len:424 (-) Transcript_14133:132-1403(-)
MLGGGVVGVEIGVAVLLIPEPARALLVPDHKLQTHELIGALARELDGELLDRVAQVLLAGFDLVLVESLGGEAALAGHKRRLDAHVAHGGGLCGPHGGLGEEPLTGLVLGDAPVQHEVVLRVGGDDHAAAQHPLPRAARRGLILRDILVHLHEHLGIVPEGVQALVHQGVRRVEAGPPGHERLGAVLGRGDLVAPRVVRDDRPKIAVRVGVGVVLANLLGRGLDPLLGLDGHFLLLTAAGDVDGGREVVERGRPGLHRDDVGRRAGELARGVVEHDVRVAAGEDGLVVAVDGVLVVPAAYVVEGDAVENLELEVQPGLGVLGGLPLGGRVLGHAGLFPAHVRADADEVLGHDDLGDIDDAIAFGGLAGLRAGDGRDGPPRGRGASRGAQRGGAAHRPPGARGKELRRPHDTSSAHRGSRHRCA